MTDIEKLFNEAKEEINQLEAPKEMESKLWHVLNDVPTKKRRFTNRRKVAVLIIALLLISYNIDSLAYYGKQIIGYGNVMNGTLKELNKLGKGQIIDKSYRFKSGIEITLDGIMLDDNNLIAFYTIKDPTDNIEDIYSVLNITMEGLFGNVYNFYGIGLPSEGGKEDKWVVTFDKPKFFEKKMKLKIGLMGDYEEGKIEFKLDRNSAMGHNLKLRINKEIQLEQGKIKIKSLVASPTSTVIRGQIQNIVELGIDHLKGERFRPENIRFILFADDKEVRINSSGISTDMKGVNFYIEYDALPIDTENIQIKLISLGGNYDVNEVVELQKDDIRKNINILGQDIIINKIYESEGNTYINITTDENLTLSKVLLDIDGEKVKPEKTIPGDYEKTKHTRTIEFRGTGEKLSLEIERIRYNKEYDKLIYRYE